MFRASGLSGLEGLILPKLAFRATLVMMMWTAILMEFAKKMELVNVE